MPIAILVSRAGCDTVSHYILHCAKTRTCCRHRHTALQVSNANCATEMEGETHGINRQKHVTAGELFYFE